jgi:putative transposase
MQILRAYKYELDPNDRQRTLLVRSAGAARFVYNWGLGQKQQARREGRRAPNAVELHRRLNALKAAQLPWLYHVSKCCGQEALRDLDRAFHNFFAKRAGYPRFKSRKRGLGGVRLTGSIRIEGRYVSLPRLGTLKLKEDSRVEGRILSASVREVAGKWFVSIRVEQEMAFRENQAPAVGVDLGVNRLATLSDGTAFENPRALRSRLGLLRCASRQLARRRKGASAGRGCGGGWRGCTTASLSGAIADCGFGELRRQLGYKCQWYGSELVVHDRFFASSKACSGCGAVKAELPLSERTYRCETCGLEIDRDRNAALNLLPAESQSARTPVRRSLDVEAAAPAGGDIPARKPSRRSVNRT